MRSNDEHDAMTGGLPHDYTAQSCDEACLILIGIETSRSAARNVYVVMLAKSRSDMGVTSSLNTDRVWAQSILTLTMTSRV
ncbi:MAG: hypothetical protein INR71_00370 [Terriglobus roseus]|nr:hypothetical protein [Terriglobus roseus]